MDRMAIVILLVVVASIWLGVQAQLEISPHPNLTPTPTTPTPTPGPCETDEDCRWCAGGCVKDTGQQCIQIAPPNNCDCRCVEGECVAVCSTPAPSPTPTLTPTPQVKCVTCGNVTSYMDYWGRTWSVSEEFCKYKNDTIIHKVCLNPPWVGVNTTDRKCIKEEKEVNLEEVPCLSVNKLECLCLG